METGLPPPLIDMSNLQEEDEGYLPCDVDKDDSSFSRTQVSVPNSDSHRSDSAVDESHLCVGVAYDYGQYPKIVAVHSSIDQASPLSKKAPEESKSSKSPGHREFELGNEEERPNFGAPCSTERLQHPMRLEYPDCHQFLGSQIEVMNQGFPRNRFAMPNNFHDVAKQHTVRYQNERLTDASVFPSTFPQFQHLRPQLNRFVHPVNIAESPQFRHFGYSVNRFQTPLIYGMCSTRPEMNVILHNHLSPLHRNHATSQRPPSVNVRSNKQARGTDIGSCQFGNTSSTYPGGKSYISNSRKRNYHQSNCGSIIEESFPSFGNQKLSVPSNFMFPGNDMIRPGVPVADDRMGMMRLHQEKYPLSRHSYFYRPTCNEIVNAAILSARRYATDNERLTNDKACEDEPSFAKNDIGYPQKTCPLNVPEHWMSREFFQCLLLHKNRLELLYILKKAASSGREMLLYVIHRLLAKNLYKTSLLILDSLRRSNLPDIVKEKVLSVVQEIVWHRSPRFDLWSNNVMENGQANTGKEVVEDKEKSEESHYENGISHNHLKTVKKNSNSLLYFENTTDQTYVAGIDNGRALLHEDIVQKSPANCCDRELDGIGKHPKDKEESEEGHCEIETLNDHLDTAKEDASSMLCFESITDQADSASIDDRKASLHKTALQKSPANSCDMELGGIGKDPRVMEESENNHCESGTLHDDLDTAKEDADSLPCFENTTYQTGMTNIDSGKASLHEDFMQKSPAHCCDSDLDEIYKYPRDKEESGEGRCKSRILHDHLDTSKKAANSLLCVESITDQTDVADTDNRKALAPEDVLQKSPEYCCDRDLDCVGRELQDNRGAVNTLMKKEENNNSVERGVDDFGRESHDNHGTFSTLVKKEINNNSGDVSSCCEIEGSHRESILLESLLDVEEHPKELTERREGANVSSTQDHLDEDCFQTRDQCIQVEGIDNFTASISPSRDITETNQAVLDEDAYAGFFSFDKLTDLENSNLEILGNISITLDSQGHTIINKEFSDEINFEDEITIKGFKILREWIEPIGKDANLLAVTDRTCYANIQS